MSPKDADGMENSVDPDRTDPVIYTVYPGLYVRKLTGSLRYTDSTAVQWIINLIFWNTALTSVITELFLNHNTVRWESAIAIYTQRQWKGTTFQISMFWKS